MEKPDIQERSLSGVTTGLIFYLSNIEVLHIIYIYTYSLHILKIKLQSNKFNFHRFQNFIKLAVIQKKSDWMSHLGETLILPSFHWRGWVFPVASW